jgi:hypothetical protein
MTCKTCVFWDRDFVGNKKGHCTTIYGNEGKDDGIDIEAYDDSGLSVTTGCNFGCVHYKSKKEKTR